MALQKELESKAGVIGNYISIHAVNYDNEKKSITYSVALYLNEAVKHAGAEPLEILYQGQRNNASGNELVAQCYLDLKSLESRLFTDAIDV